MSAVESATPVRPAFEIAVYRAEDPEELTARHGEIHAALKEYEGFLASMPLRSTQEPAVFADVVMWRNATAAKAAAAAIGADPGLAWFSRAIAELQLFLHFTPVEVPPAPERLLSAPLVEIAAYRPAAPQQHRRLHRLLHAEKLPGRHGVVAHVALAGIEESMVADLVGWSSEAAMHATQETLMADPDLAGFFDPPEETKVFALFAPTAQAAQSTPQSTPRSTPQSTP